MRIFVYFFLTKFHIRVRVKVRFNISIKRFRGNLIALYAVGLYTRGVLIWDRGLTRIMRDELHWLSVPQRIKFKLGTMMHRCLHNSAPRYLSVAGPTVWNSLPDKLRDPSLSIDSFRRQLKTFLFVD